HKFREKVLAVEPSRLVSKTARFYEIAKSNVTVAGTPSNRSLRGDRAVIVAQRANDAFNAYCPQGPLTQDELEVVSGHLDTLSLPGLLPQKEVKVGDTWKIGPSAVQGLCLFEGLIAHELTGKLTEVKGDSAIFTVTGTAKGIDLGAQAALTVNATGKYDIKKKQIVFLEWKQKDQRDQGPASPAMTAELVVTLSRAVTEEPRQLSTVALESVPKGLELPEGLTHLVYQDPKGHYE